MSHELEYYAWLQEEHYYYQEMDYLNTCDELNDTLTTQDSELFLNLIVGV